jgi:hypothetical protein
MDVFTIEDFLNESEVLTLLEFVDNEKENFQRSLDDGGSHVPYFDCTNQCRWFSQKLHGMLNQIVTALNRSMFEAEPAMFEAELTRNLSTGRRSTTIRDRYEIGFAYHFYSLPGQFTGGEMTYKDKDDTIVTLPPKRNSIHFYAADLDYQVAPTEQGCRYTIHGYLSRDSQRRQ